MSAVVRIAAGVVNAEVLQPTAQIKSLLTDWLSYENNGESEFRGNAVQSGHGTLFDWGTNRFPAGFVPTIKQRMAKAGLKVVVHNAKAPAPKGQARAKVDDFPEDPRYEYQHKTVDRLVELRRMIAMIATGGGKSRIARLAYRRIGDTTLFVTTRKSLAYQMAASINRDLKESCGFLGDGKWEFIEGGFNVAIADTLSARMEPRELDDELANVVERLHGELEKTYTAQAKAARLPVGAKAKPTQEQQEALDKLYDRLRQDQDRTWTTERIAALAKKKLKEHSARRKSTIAVLHKVAFTIVEEAHEVSAAGFYNVMATCRNAHYRLALTATPFMRESGEANMRLMAATGPIGIQVTEKMLIDLGILARPYFRFLSVPAPAGVARGTPWQKAYQMGIQENLARNKMIVKEVMRGRMFGLTSMILIQRKDHGKWLCDALKKLGVRAAFISGDDKQDERQRWLDALGTGEIDALIGSNILDVGVDVPAVGMVIIAGGGKAEVAQRQRIGRGLRAKKAGPNVCLVVDFVEEFNKTLLKHARQRYEIVKSTPGFAEGIIDPSQPFPYEALGFQKTAWRPAA